MSNANGWKEVEAEIGRIVGESTSPFDSETVSNVRDFVRFARDRCPTPSVSKGYWATIVFDWDDAGDCRDLQIEVFADHFEVYRFKPKFALWYESHNVGQPFSSKFVAELPPLS